MRIAITSHIYSNLDALTEVLEYIAREKMDEIWCPGDIVGDGPWQNECILYS